MSRSSLKIILLLVFALSASLATASGPAAPAPSVSVPSPNLEALVNAGHYKQLRSIVEPRLQKNANDAEALYFMSKVKMALGDRDAAYDLAEKAVSLDGSKADYHCQYAKASGDKALHAGMFEKFKLARNMKKEGETAIQLDPKHLDARYGMVLFHLQAPGMVGGEKSMAYKLADEMVKIDPAEGYLAQAEIASEEKHPEQIEGLYLKAVQANPKSYKAQTSLAGFYLGNAPKKYELSEKYAKEAMKLDPNRATAYSLLAIQYATQQRIPELEALLALAEKNVPDDLNPIFQAGKTLMLNGQDFPRAEGYLRKYMAREPEAGAPHLGAAHWRLGQLYEKMGKKAEAVAEMQTAVNLKPDFEPAKNDLKRLK